jgi:hypothetical protein
VLSRSRSLTLLQSELAIWFHGAKIMQTGVSSVGRALSVAISSRAVYSDDGQCFQMALRLDARNRLYRAIHIHLAIGTCANTCALAQVCGNATSRQYDHSFEVFDHTEMGRPQNQDSKYGTAVEVRHAPKLHTNKVSDCKSLESGLTDTAARRRVRSAPNEAARNNHLPQVARSKLRLHQLRAIRFRLFDLQSNRSGGNFEAHR